MTSSELTRAQLTRRGVLTGAAALGVGTALAACSTDSPGTGTGTGPAAASTPTPTTVKVADVPVGGAVISGDVVVSQATAGNYKAFSAVCTHQSCLVSRVEGTKIICACHGSEFNGTDGSVIAGPANRPLTAKTVTASADTLTIT